MFFKLNKTNGIRDLNKRPSINERLIENKKQRFH